MAVLFRPRPGPGAVSPVPRTSTRQTAACPSSTAARLAVRSRRNCTLPPAEKPRTTGGFVPAAIAWGVNNNRGTRTPGSVVSSTRSSVIPPRRSRRTDWAAGMGAGSLLPRSRVRSARSPGRCSSGDWPSRSRRAAASRSSASSPSRSASLRGRISVSNLGERHRSRSAGNRFWYSASGFTSISNQRRSASWIRTRCTGPMWVQCVASGGCFVTSPLPKVKASRSGTSWKP